MQPELIVKFLLLLAIANGAPVLAKRLMGGFLATPLDGGRTFLDGRPLLGASKTVRGILLSLIATALLAPLLGFAWTAGLLVGATAMAGDLLSSFVKRRMGLAPSARAFALDQIPESLLPALACMHLLALTPADVVAIAAVFWGVSVVLSRLLYKIKLRDRPY